MNLERLKQFCAPDTDPRDYLHQPFNLGGDLVASNGHVLMVIPDGATSDFKNEDREGIGRVIGTIKEASTGPLNDIVSSEPKACRRCGGTGKLQVTECRECGGEGEVDAETDYSTYPNLECKSCLGEGVIERPGDEIDCGFCEGSGHIPETDQVWLNDFSKPIQRRYWNLVSDLPGLTVGYPDDGLVVFRFDGGMGAIMGMRNQQRPRSAA